MSTDCERCSTGLLLAELERKATRCMDCVSDDRKDPLVQALIRVAQAADAFVADRCEVSDVVVAAPGAVQINPPPPRPEWDRLVCALEDDEVSAVMDAMDAERRRAG